jgi:tetrahydromethanopterin S-methyltransferase subunit C
MIVFGSAVIAMRTHQIRYGSPIVATVLAAVIGFVLGYVSNNILNMKIPHGPGTYRNGSSGCPYLMGFAALITGIHLGSDHRRSRCSDIHAYPELFIVAHLSPLHSLLGAIAIQHPFNATLGPGWKQDRMLMLTAECGFLSMIAAAFMSFALISMEAAIISLVIAIIGWAYTYNQYICLSKRDAAAWLDAKPIPDMEGH